MVLYEEHMKFDTKQESFDGTVSSEIDSTLYNFIKYLPGCIYLKDINGRYLACSDYLLTDSALASRKIVIGQADHDLFDRHYADQLRQNDLQVIGKWDDYRRWHPDIAREVAQQFPQVKKFCSKPVS